MCGEAKVEGKTSEMYIAERKCKAARELAIACTNITEFRILGKF